MAPFLVFALLSSPLPVKDYGVDGHTFPIEEEDLIDYLKRRMQAITPQEIEQINSRVQAQYKAQLLEPTPVKNLHEAAEYSVRYYDPTIVSKRDIKDTQGNIIVAKGASYNPLHHFSLKEDLLFFAGGDPDHVEWAKLLGEGTKWILVSGKPLNLEESENRPVYFDQNGQLTQKLKIVAIPSRVSQEAGLLKIEAIPVQEKVCGN